MNLCARCCFLQDFRPFSLWVAFLKRPAILPAFLPLSSRFDPDHDCPSSEKAALVSAAVVALILLLTATAGAQISPKGRLINGDSVLGRISPAFEIDTFAFKVRAGESVILNTVELTGINFDPQVNIYKPDGSLLLWDWGPAILGIGFTATMTGVYTMELKDYRSGGGTGVYEIHYVRAPGASEHGELVNGGSVTESLDFGDIDSFTLTASQGDSVLLNVVDLGGVNLEPQVNIYKPDGSLQLWDYGQTICGVSFNAGMSGVYTVVVRDYRSGGGTDPTKFTARGLLAPMSMAS